MAGGNRGLWSLRMPLEHLGARVFPDMFSLAMAHKAFDGDTIADATLLAGAAFLFQRKVLAALERIAGLMGVVANYPLALATGLGLNAFVTFSIASQMTWADAMGLVVI